MSRLCPSGQRVERVIFFHPPPFFVPALFHNDCDLCTLISEAGLLFSSPIHRLLGWATGEPHRARDDPSESLGLAKAACPG